MEEWARVGTKWQEHWARPLLQQSLGEGDWMRDKAVGIYRLLYLWVSFVVVVLKRLLLLLFTNGMANAVLEKNLILKYGRSDSGLSSLGTKSPFVCQFSINFLKYFLDDCFIPGKSEKTLRANVQPFSWTVRYSPGIRRLDFNIIMSKACPFFPPQYRAG